MIAMARWFDRRRGRALSVAALGYPAGESLFPPLAAILLVSMTWRDIWYAASLSILGIVIPLIFVLRGMVRSRGLDQPKIDVASETAVETVSWTRGDVLRDVRFYALLPGLMAPPFIITGVLFHQVHLVETKNWALSDFATLYPFYAISSVLAAIAGGWFVDRFGTARLLPIYLLPMSCGLVLIAATLTFTSAVLFMLLLGATAGGATVVLGALWAELYGTDHLGSIRALSMALLVLATAIAPGLMGAFLDAGFSLEAQFMVMAAYSCVYSLFFALVQPVLRFAPPSSF